MDTHKTIAKVREPSPSPDTCHRRILGIRFFVGSSEQAVARGLAGGLVVVPAAPALVEIVRDPSYNESLQYADLVITDSGFMVLAWRFLTGERLPRTSGLRYLRLALESPSLREGPPPVWVMPSLDAARKLVRWLQSAGFAGSLDQCYIAPVYPKGLLQDENLLAFVRERQPRQIFVALGGGTQEKIGLYLRRQLNQLDWMPGIHCIGAAIGFLTGDQVHIPDWADRWMLGWLFRCWDQPGRFVPRYWRGGKLFYLLWKYRDASPVS